MEFRLRTQGEGVEKPVIGNADTAGREAVHGIWLVARTYHQRCERKLHALRSVTLENEAVERIEGQERLIELAVRSDLREYSAFRRFWIDIIEVRKIRWVAEIAERRHAVLVDIFRRNENDAIADARRGHTGQKSQSTAATESHRYDRCGTLAALSASHHHTVGKAERPYFGIVSG